MIMGQSQIAPVNNYYLTLFYVDSLLASQNILSFGVNLNGARTNYFPYSHIKGLIKTLIFFLLMPLLNSSNR